MKSLLSKNAVRALAILLVAALADVWLAYSGPGSLDSLSLLALLGVLAALALFFAGILQSLPHPAALAAAFLCAVLLGVHPSNLELLRNSAGIRMLLGLFGVVSAFVLYQRRFTGPLHWIFLAPVAAAALCDRVALGFAPLLLAYMLLFDESPSWSSVPRILAHCIPAALLSLLVFVIPGADASASQPEIGSALRAFLAFVHPDPSLTDQVSSTLEIATAIAFLGIAAFTSWRSATRPLGFGLIWFLVMLIAAPDQFLPAYAGLALVAAWIVAELLTLVRGPRRWMVTAACAALLAACGTDVTQKNDKPATPPPAATATATSASADSLVTPSMTAEQWLNLSLYAYQHGKYLESIAAAQTALKLKPDYADAYNNIAASYSALRLWDFAIANAQEALRIRPDYQLARNNLNWALEQKRLATH